MNEILLIITVLCRLNTPGIEMPKEEKILCIEEYTNCLVGPNGKLLRDQIKSCENKYKINRANRSKND